MHMVIVGGGATGVLLACHLLRDPRRTVQVTIIEKSADAGLGLAYSTRNPQHLLNVRASNMSAFPDDPGHFWRWVTANHLDAISGCAGDFCFVPRAIYGRYLNELLEFHRAERAPRQRLHLVHAACTGLSPSRTGIEANLADGSRVFGHIAVLATGNEAPPNPCGPCGASPWQEPRQSGVKPDDAVLIVGSGLTMVDYVLSLLRAGHRGPITAMSRRGLLPQPHRAVTPLALDAADVPFDADISLFLRWLRRMTEGAGHDWRAVVDVLRPFTRDIWQSWPEPVQRRFLRHARAFWDVHRHRTAPEIHEHLRTAIASGAVNVLAGKIEQVTIEQGSATVHYRRRRARQMESMHVAKIVSCAGVGVALRDSANPVLQSLLAQGLIRPDPLGIGLDVTPDCGAIGRSGKPSETLFAVGPLTRGRFWEITAVPDIRVQCAALAQRILHGMQAAAE